MSPKFSKLNWFWVAWKIYIIKTNLVITKMFLGISLPDEFISGVKTYFWKLWFSTNQEEATFKKIARYGFLEFFWILAFSTNASDLGHPNSTVMCLYLFYREFYLKWNYVMDYVNIEQNRKFELDNNCMPHFGKV